MDPDPPPRVPRKVKFAPIRPARRTPNPSTAKIETVGDDVDEDAKQHLPRKSHDDNTYYPITLPWRKPDSGNPEDLDKAEFEDAPEYDENSVSSASELGLLDIDGPPGMLLFKFPCNLPLGNSRPSKSSKGCTLEDLPGGHMGKMLVYKSGAVKLKLGDVLFDVSPGVDCRCTQCLMAINTTDRECRELGKVNKLAMVTPDIDSLLD